MTSTLHWVEALAATSCQCTSSPGPIARHNRLDYRNSVSVKRIPCTLPSLRGQQLGSQLKKNSPIFQGRRVFDIHRCVKCESVVAEQGGGIEDGGGIKALKTLQEEIKLVPSSSSLSVTATSEWTTVNSSAATSADGILREIAASRENGDSSSSCVAPIENALEKEAWALLKEAIVTYCGEPVGTIAANDPTDPHPMNYDQVFIRDFIPSATAFLLKGEYEIVRNFLLHTLQLQSWEKTVDCYSPGQGLMPASFKVRTVYLDGNPENGTEEILDPDFGEAAIGRVAPVDSGLWWIILLRAYGKCTGDMSLQERVDVQTGMKMILKVCLADGFDMFPSLLVTDGSCMIDRRMGIHGHPLEIQALFYQALRCAREILLADDGAQELTRAINSRLAALSFHIQEYYWLDLRKLNEIYRYKTEEYSTEAVNKFNIYPEQVSQWLLEWMPEQGGYFIGNLQPAHMDFRWFALGNVWTICGALATKEQSEEILKLIEAKWDDLIGTMPMKICFPALTEDEWRIITGADPKTLACIKMNRPDLAEKAVRVAEQRLSRDQWPEYYDTRSGRLIGKQARLYQTWSIAGYLTAKMMLKNPEAASWLTCEEEDAFASMMSCGIEMNPRQKPRLKPSVKSFII